MSKDKKIISPDRIFYWAYGSNLSTRQMARRCPRAIKYGPMTVKDCALIFRGVADVTVREGSTTPGGLYQITTACERELDAFEGVAQGRYVKRYFNLVISKKKYVCLFYQMRTKDGIMPPSEEYLDRIAEGYGDFRLDLRQLDAALHESWGSKELTQDLVDRHARRGCPRLARALWQPPAHEFADEELTQRIES